VYGCDHPSPKNITSRKPGSMLTSVRAAIVSRTTNQGKATYAAVSAAITATAVIHRTTSLRGTAMPFRHGRRERPTPTCQQKAAPDIDAIR